MGESSEAVSQPPSASAAAGSRAVFLSYASPDAGVANQVCQFLEARGVACWMAPRDVKPGAAYADAIVRAINEASALVLVLSASTMASEHVSREVERAASKHKPVVAFRVDAANLSAELEYFLSRSQWIDVPALGMPAALVKLVEAVRQGSAAARGNPGLVAAGGASVNQAVGMASVAKRVVLGAAVVIALGVGGVLAVRFGQSKHGETPAPSMAAISDKSIAVLPFTDMSQKKDQEYFGDGMAEEILDLLAKIPGLTVIGRTSSFQFKGKNEDLRTIGAKLNAAYVLEGSVRNSGDQVRITAQLINTRTGAHEWSETYDRPIGDVLKLQDAIAAAVVRELQLTVAPAYLGSRSTVRDTEAYDLVLRGRHAADRWDEEGVQESVTLLRQALDRDPTSADTAAELARAYARQGEEAYIAPAVAFEQARRTAAGALKLDPTNALAHFELGFIHLVYDWDWMSADQEFQRCAILAPGGAEAPHGEAMLSLTLGRWDDALRQIKVALTRDPLHPGSYWHLAQIQMRRGHLPEAELAMRRMLDIRPTFNGAHYWLGLVLLARGNADAALLEMQKQSDDLYKKYGVAIVEYTIGRKSASDAVLTQMLRDQSGGDAGSIAALYALRGQSDQAFDWLDRAYQKKEPWLIYFKGDWLLRSLETDPRYKAFLKKMNLPE